MQAVAVPQAVPQKGGDMSKMTFAFGILSLIVPLASPIAVILGIIALATKRARRGLALAGLIIGAIPILLLVLLVILISVFGLRGFGYHGVGHQRAYCLSQLHGIGKGVHLYAAGNNGQYPFALEDLIEDQYISRKMLRSPADKIDLACSYFYFAPNTESPDEAFMACTFDDVYKQFRHVLYFDGTVKKLSETEFQAELAKPYNAKFAAALKQAARP